MERGGALLNGGSAFYHLYETSDKRFVSLGAIEPKFWANFCTAVAKPDWIARQADGRGRFLDVSIAETVLPWQMLAFTSERRGGFAMERGGALLNGGSAFYHLYETSDKRFVSLGAIEPKFWANFCTAVAKPDWIARQAEPVPQRGLTAEVAALIASRSLIDWVETLEAVDCCFEPIHEIADTLAHPHIKARGMVHEVGGSEPRVEVAYPAWVDGAPPPAPEPVRFADVDAVLEEWS